MKKCDFDGTRITVPSIVLFIWIAHAWLVLLVAATKMLLEEAMLVVGTKQNLSDLHCLLISMSFNLSVCLSVYVSLFSTLAVYFQIFLFFPFHITSLSIPSFSRHLMLLVLKRPPCTLSVCQFIHLSYECLPF
jgi:hypothetical protein